MYFNSGANSLYADALFWSGAQSLSFPVDPDFTRLANTALDRIYAYIQRADNTTQADDTNLSTELLDITLAVISGTSKYAKGTTWRKIARVRVKDSAGNWITLDPVDRRQLSDSELAATGTPTTYDVLGNFFYLHPTPDYSGGAASIEVQYQRRPDYFEAADTTVEPGFDPNFHRMVSFMAALDYVEANSIPNRANAIKEKLGHAPSIDGRDPGSGMIRDLFEHYSSRDLDMVPNISLRKTDYGASALGQD